MVVIIGCLPGCKTVLSNNLQVCTSVNSWKCQDIILDILIFTIFFILEVAILNSSVRENAQCSSASFTNQVLMTIEENYFK